MYQCVSKNAVTCLAFDQLLGHLDGRLAESSSVLGTHFSTDCEEGRVFSMCLCVGGGGAHTGT